jgi:hypothetical protein
VYQQRVVCCACRLWDGAKLSWRTSLGCARRGAFGDKEMQESFRDDGEAGIVEKLESSPYQMLVE